MMASPTQLLAARSSTRALRSSACAPFTTPRSVTARSLTVHHPHKLSTSSKTKTDQYPDDEHTTSKSKKGDQLDVQSANAASGVNSGKKDTGGAATQGKDTSGAVSKAKSEHPEAPDPAIGMQDERGGRGA